MSPTVPRERRTGAPVHLISAADPGRAECGFKLSRHDATVATAEGVTCSLCNNRLKLERLMS